MLEIGTSGSMSGEGKRGVAAWPKLRVSPQLYQTAWVSAFRDGNGQMNEACPKHPAFERTWSSP